MEIKVMQKVMQANIDKANVIRKLLYEKDVSMINLIGSPGAGKTLLLDNTLNALTNKYNIAVIEGDIASDKDALRLQKHDVPIVLINTGGSCHLDSMSIEKAIAEFDLNELDLIFIENVGNLVCPAEFDVGENCKVAVSSVTEGDDKPEKYPLLFREAELVLLNKIDLIPYTNFDKNGFCERIKNLNGLLPIIEVSSSDKTGMDEWINWVEKNVKKDIKEHSCVN